MKAITNSSNCPNCGNNHKSKPYCEYENGWHCFSCGMSKIYDRSFSVPEHNNKIEIPEWPNAKTNPDDFNVENLIKLTSYGITHELIRKFRIMETDNLGLIFPNFNENNELVSYQIRWYSPRRIITKGEKITQIAINQDWLENTIVVVEDFLSWIRVGQVCTCLCLFGTKMPHDDMQQIINVYKNIVIWLDNDHTKDVNSGQIAAQKLKTQLEWIIKKRQRRYGFTILDSRIANIVTDKDPKEYVDEEMREIIGEYT